jgi:hypothetical protein
MQMAGAEGYVVLITGRTPVPAKLLCSLLALVVLLVLVVEEADKCWRWTHGDRRRAA